MRFKSKTRDGFQAFAVSGTNTVSFAITATNAARQGLLGFEVERVDPTENQRFTIPGFKVFRSVVPNPNGPLNVSTHDHPVQSFVWDDFTAKPDHPYEYIFRPLRGTPKNLDRSAAPVPIKVRTEALFTNGEHDIFFNRGVASSQAYARRFGNKMPKDLDEPKKTQALQWLSRELDDAILRFIGEARSGDTLLCCFYEFRYLPVAEAISEAIDRGVHVRLIVDAKVNEFTDKHGVFHESFPRVENLKTIRKAQIPAANVIKRDANPSDIQHNKFIVLLKGNQKRPTAVWTGSTNISLGGITGQTNVGHWVRNTAVADSFRKYWEVLAKNPGSRKGDDDATANTRKKECRQSVEKLGVPPADLAAIPNGVTPVFSPRSGLKVLNFYVNLLDSARRSACITLAFGINATFKKQLMDNTAAANALTFMLLEKKDKPRVNAKTPFVALTAAHNIYSAWGAFIEDPVYQWVRETNAKKLQLNQHVSYVHSKFLLMDPLGDDPIVITGSANFSEASTTANDENMLIIRGNQRVADIYFTEFNRLFNHYYFRAVHEDRRARNGNGNAASTAGASLFLDETGREWLRKYAPRTLRSKRVAMYAGMAGAQTL